MSRWIGFTGKMGAGKDYSYQWLSDHGYKVIRVSFADGLRIEIEQTLKLHERITKPYTELERKLQQWWGTDYRRAEDPDYWVKMAEERAKVFQGETGLTPVFTDVRFPNEANMIKDNGGLIVRLSASSVVRKGRLDVRELPNHESETAMDNYHTDRWIPTDLGPQTYEDKMTWLAESAEL